jgi:tetratricopeptide (TPR) repeat protein
MGAVTYPNEQVAEAIMENFVPVQLDISEDKGALERFQAVWTPTLMVRDDGGREYRRSEGYLSPDELLSELALARAQAMLHMGEYDAAVERANRAKNRAKDDPERLAEAMYWAGVAGYKASKDGKDLMAEWRPLVEQHPDTIWAKKAGFIKDS